jgi:ubiquinone/menaquinone biosynthesis C-methylase UbiE
MEKKPLGAGSSSINLINKDLLFQSLDLKKDTILLDLACGSGNYSIAAAGFIDNSGLIYAVDLWKEGISSLRDYALKNNIPQIRAILADVGKELPIDTGSVDVCLMATVIHDFVRIGSHDTALKETSRVLKSTGRLAAVEFKKMEGPPGPPMEVKLSSEELNGLVGKYGFSQKLVIEIGPYNYLSIFEKKIPIQENSQT